MSLTDGHGHIAVAVGAGEGDDSGGEKAMASGDLFDPEVFDHLIGEQLAAHIIERGIADVLSATSSSIRRPARTSLTPAKPKPFKRMMDRAALRIEHPVLEADVNADFHGQAFHGAAWRLACAYASVQRGEQVSGF